MLKRQEKMNANVVINLLPFFLKTKGGFKLIFYLRADLLTESNKLTYNLLIYMLNLKILLIFIDFFKVL